VRIKQGVQQPRLATGRDRGHHGGIDDVEVECARGRRSPPRSTWPSRSTAGELHLIVDIGLVGTQPLRLKVPPVEPGEYRIAKEVTRERPAAQRQVTLSARLRVTG
jgi:hypothetical protein